MTKEPQKNDTENPCKNFSSLKVLIAGSLSGIVSSIVLQPFNVLKTRLQNPRIMIKDGKPNRQGIIYILNHIKKHENVKVLWAGTIPTILRSVPGSGIYFFIYDTIRVKFFSTHPPNTVESLVMGMVTRGLSDVIVIPLTVIKTRIESGVYKYRGVYDAIKEIYKNEGFRGLRSGLVPVLIRDCPMSGIYVMCYYQTHALVPKEFCHKHSLYVNSSCAAISGVLASILTHPSDVLKTQMQLFPSKYPNLRSAMIGVYLSHGVPGYFQGIIPRLLKRTVFAAISWPLYEKVALKNKETYGI